MSEFPKARVHLDAVDVSTAQEMGLLRPEVKICMDDSSIESFGVAYDRNNNLSTEIFETRSALQQRCRQFAVQRGFALRVSSTSWSRAKQEGNAKYVCKLQKGQQQLVQGSVPACPFHINVYGKDNKWKITRVQLTHDHHKSVGFQSQTFVESRLGTDHTIMRQRDSAFPALVNLVERELLPAYQENWSCIKGKAIIQWLLSKRHRVDRQMASRIKCEVSDRMQGNINESYQKLESYLSEVARNNPGSHFAFDKPGETSQRACFFPSACLRAQRHCKPVIGLDGTHLKGEMHKRGVYLVATTKDFNSHVLIFGLALVSAENYDNWLWFLEHLRLALACTTAVSHESTFAHERVGECSASDDSAFNGASNDTAAVSTESDESAINHVFISDRKKGLLAVVKVFPRSGHRYCLRHIIGNISKLGSVLSPQEQATVFAMAPAESENDFNYELARLAETRQRAADYLSALPKEHWVTYALQENISSPTFDEVTSNMSESANNWIGNDIRSLNPLHAFEQYMMKVVDQFAARRREASRGMTTRLVNVCEDSASQGPTKGPTATSSHVMARDFDRFVAARGFQGLVPFYAKKLENLLKMSKTCDVMPCLDGLYMVRFVDPSSRPGYVHVWRAVDLKARECTCKKWQDDKFPCIHAVRAAERCGVHLSELFEWEQFYVATYVQAYNYQFVPAVTRALHCDISLGVPQVQRQPDELGQPGPKPKHKRRTAKVGAATNPNVALTQ